MIRVNKKAIRGTIFIYLIISLAFLSYTIIAHQSFIPNEHNLNIITCIPIQSDKATIPIDKAVEQLHTEKNIDATLGLFYDQKLQVKSGILLKNYQSPIIIYSRGYHKDAKLGTNDNLIQKGGCIKSVFLAYKYQIIPSIACITFDYPDEPAYFNFGQQLDQECLRLVYQKTVSLNPQAPIILVGDCRGAKCALEIALHNPANLKALVLMSPLFPGKYLAKKLAHNYLSWLPKGDRFLDLFFQLYFPLYNPYEIPIFNRLSTINRSLPILIGHRKGDHLISQNEIEKLITGLQKAHNSYVTAVIVNDNQATHSRLYLVPEFKKQIQKFFGSLDIIF